MIKKAGLLLTITSAVLLASSTIAVAKTSSARAHLNNFFTKVSSMKGSFNQQVFSKKGKLIQSSTGLIYLSRPGRFRWVYKTPDPQTIVSDGKNIWIYDEDLEQVTIKPLSRALSSAPIAILTRKQSPDAQFIVKPLNKKSGLDWFQLTPRKRSNDFRSIEMGLDRNGAMRQMVMLDQLGQKTVIKLNTQTNVPIAGKTFYFKPPVGVDIIGKVL